MNSPTDTAQWEKLVISPPHHHQLSSSFPLTLWTRKASPRSCTSLGPYKCPASRTCHKGSQVSSSRSSSALYKPYQDSSARISPSQSRDKPGRGVSPSRINIYKAWLTPPPSSILLPSSTQCTLGESSSALFQAVTLWLYSGGLAQFQGSPSLVWM